MALTVSFNFMYLAREASPLSVHVNRDSWVKRWNIEISVSIVLSTIGVLLSR